MEHKKLGRFEVQALVGKGAMGSVYRAFDPKLKRVVAIKTINLDRIDEEHVRREMFERFNREAEICASLRHPNIAAIYDVGEFENGPFLTMEFVDGKPLSKFIGAQERPDFELCCSILHDIASGLDYAHAQGVVHRDIKPSNILISQENQAIIVDFGIAKIGEHKMTKSGVYLGTPTYSSPEQIKGQKVDFRTDIFSFGVLAHELITNRTPYPGDSVNSILFKIVHEPPQIAPPLSLSDYDESALKHVFAKVMDSDPDKRYQSCTVFAGELIFGLKNQPVPSLGRPQRDPAAEETELLSEMEARPTERVGGPDDRPEPPEAATELMTSSEAQPTQLAESGGAVMPPAIGPDIRPPSGPVMEKPLISGREGSRIPAIWIAAAALAVALVVVFVVWMQSRPAGGATQNPNLDLPGSGEIQQLQSNEIQEPLVAGDAGRDHGQMPETGEIVTPEAEDDPTGGGHRIVGESRGDGSKQATQTAKVEEEVIQDPPPVEKVEDLTDEILILKQSVGEFREEVKTHRLFVQRADRLVEKIAALERDAPKLRFRHQEKRLRSLDGEFEQLQDDFARLKQEAQDRLQKLTDN